MEESVNLKAISAKWQKKWEENKTFHVVEDPAKKKWYCLEMFPYPSGSGLHMGHALNYTIGDIYARFKRMQGFNVIYPMGYDAFGLPAENAAIKAGEHPASYTENSMANFVLQQKALGLSYDWERKVVTCSPDYYKWNQFFFIKFFEKGLVYRKKSAVNWCPKCNTVLANEQVHSGKCWRHEDTEVEMKQLEQWFIKTTAYTDELLEGIKTLDWPERIKIMQENWIGKSQGTEIVFQINNSPWHIFTTRPDTIFGVTFMVVAAQHPRLFELVTKEQKSAVDAFLKKLKSVSEKELEEMEKEGVFTGSYAINPMTNEKVPVYAGNFVIADYGSGMVMAVPAHDQRDSEFAKKYNIPIKIVIQRNNQTDWKDILDNYPEKINCAFTDCAFTDYGFLINSNEFNGMGSEEAIEAITKHLEKKGLGKKTFNYKFRDWLVSRQRYWGTPIPMVYCDKCGVNPVPISDLPVLLPKNVKFGQGNPLASSQEFINTKCPKCHGAARRETDTMDTFFDSSWYYLRYCDNDNKEKPFDSKKVNYWMPVDQYIGGAEHACMHLIYARFFIKALRDMGMLNVDEPFPKLFNQGMLHGSDGNKMSKSLGNVINPIEMIDKFGADALRFNLMSLAAPDSDSVWNDKGMESSHKFIIKVFDWLLNAKTGESSKRAKSKLHRAIRDVTNYVQSFKYNMALIKIRNCFEGLEKEDIGKEDLELFIKLLHPFCPFITEEAWHKRGHKTFVSLAPWPWAEESLIDDKEEAAEELGGKIRKDILALQSLTGLTKPNKIVLVLPDGWKYNFISELKKEMEKTRNPGEIIKALTSKDKQNAKDIARMIPGFIKTPDKLPVIALSPDEEKKALQSCVESLENEFKTKIEVLSENEAKHDKAKNAMPGKPAIVFA